MGKESTSIQPSRSANLVHGSIVLLDEGLN